jgi:primosomal replication protein N''
MNVEALSVAINELKLQARQRDKAKGEHYGYLFDQSLFHCKSHLLEPCVLELDQTLTELKKYQAGNHADQAQHVEYLCDRLINQLSAIQRELATTTLRSREIQHTERPYRSVSQLYQDLSQHQEWERRLEEMLMDKNSQMETMAEYQRQPLQHAILTLEQRLSRCQSAKQKIEKAITRLERKNRR